MQVKLEFTNGDEVDYNISYEGEKTMNKMMKFFALNPFIEVGNDIYKTDMIVKITKVPDVDV